MKTIQFPSELWGTEKPFNEATGCFCPLGVIAAVEGWDVGSHYPFDAYTFLGKCGFINNDFILIWTANSNLKHENVARMLAKRGYRIEYT